MVLARKHCLGIAMPMIFAIVFIVLGIVMVFGSFNMAQKAEEVKIWPSTAGEIIKSEIEKGWTRVGTGNKRRRVPYEKPLIEYSYMVNGQSLVGDKVSFGLAEGSTTTSTGTQLGPVGVEKHEIVKSPAREIVDKYTVGAEVMVYYNPGNPSDAVLEPSASSNSNVLLIAGIVFGLAGIAVAFFKKQ